MKISHNVKQILNLIHGVAVNVISVSACFAPIMNHGAWSGVAAYVWQSSWQQNRTSQWMLAELLELYLDSKANLSGIGKKKKTG